MRRIFCLLMCCLCLLFLSSCKKQGQIVMDLEETGAEEETLVPEENDETSAAAEGEIYVYLCGAVSNPGVYKVNQNTRLYQVIDEAGGLLEDGALEYLNQARLVTDGEMIRVPTMEEAAAMETAEEAGPETASPNDTGSAKLNINQAGLGELMALPGIGESKAAGIVDYREKHGNFTSIEDIMKIDGIKSGVFNKIRDLITV